LLFERVDRTRRKDDLHRRKDDQLCIRVDLHFEIVDRLFLSDDRLCLSASRLCHSVSQQFASASLHFNKEDRLYEKSSPRVIPQSFLPEAGNGLLNKEISLSSKDSVNETDKFTTFTLLLLPLEYYRL
jgi:hypothetical protein